VSGEALPAVTEPYFRSKTAESMPSFSSVVSVRMPLSFSTTSRSRAARRPARSRRSAGRRRCPAAASRCERRAQSSCASREIRSPWPCARPPRPWSRPWWARRSPAALGIRSLGRSRLERAEPAGHRLGLGGPDEAFASLSLAGDGDVRERLRAARDHHLGLAQLDQLDPVGDRLVRGRACARDRHGRHRLRNGEPDLARDVRRLRVVHHGAVDELVHVEEKGRSGRRRRPRLGSTSGLRPRQGRDPPRPLGCASGAVLAKLRPISSFHRHFPD
jgi:hypothetical protein